uniref:P4 n=1 Tax=Jujube associated badnavirus TaxID=2761560 RepID=A0A7G7XNN1_9VIRU|nr:P4 [Jujube associated badnavirus]
MAASGSGGGSRPSPVEDPDQLNAILQLAANYRDRLRELHNRPMSAVEYDQIAKKARSTFEITKTCVLTSLAEMSQILSAQAQYFQVSASKDNYYGDLFPRLTQNREVFEKARENWKRRWLWTFLSKEAMVGHTHVPRVRVRQKLNNSVSGRSFKDTNVAVHVPPPLGNKDICLHS